MTDVSNDLEKKFHFARSERAEGRWLAIEKSSHLEIKLSRFVESKFLNSSYKEDFQITRF